jgi:hypothetical protein
VDGMADSSFNTSAIKKPLRISPVLEQAHEEEDAGDILVAAVEKRFDECQAVRLARTIW